MTIIVVHQFSMITTDFVKTHCNSKEKKKNPLITYAPSVYQDASELDLSKKINSKLKQEKN